MPEDKGLGSKFLGLFVESSSGEKGEEEDPEGQPSAAEQVATLAAQSAPRKGPPVPGGTPPAQVPLARPPPGTVPATVNFEEVFRAAGMEAADLDRVKKAEELLRSLPESTPQEIKRQIVEASLKAFGFDVQKIAAAAQGQQKAVDTWLTLNDKQTQKALADAKVKIAQLEDQVITLKADIAKRTDALAALGAAGEQRKLQVQRVLDFFQVPPPRGP